MTPAWPHALGRYAECPCGASVHVATNPPANGIHIGGDAVAVNHPRKMEARA